VAAIPVISRIMMDLGVLHTAFARIVLMVAVAEDAVLYILLAVTLGLAEGGSDQAYGLWAAVGTDAMTPTVLYYLAVSLGFFAIGTAWGPRLFRWLAGRRWNVLDRRHPVAFRLLFLFAAVSCCIGLGINPIFGALLAGLSAARGDAGLGDVQVEGRALHAWEAIRQFALAFFIPVYFALVGMHLDLIRQLDPLFFVWFLLLACAVKAASVWSAARLAGADRPAATRFAVALNARGTPGVLLATVTLTAGVINERFFAALVLVSIVTCQIAGFWLDRAFRGTVGPPVQPHRPLDAKEIA
jgi:Kef-type K+ transport system membrane component KefB